MSCSPVLRPARIGSADRRRRYAARRRAGRGSADPRGSPSIRSTAGIASRQSRAADRPGRSSRGHRHDAWPRARPRRERSDLRARSSACSTRRSRSAPDRGCWRCSRAIRRRHRCWRPTRPTARRPEVLRPVDARAGGLPPCTTRILPPSLLPRRAQFMPTRQRSNPCQNFAESGAVCPCAASTSPPT